jgi:hypothetical protein
MEQASCDFTLLDANKGAAWSLLTQLTDFDPDQRATVYDVFQNSKMLKPYLA